MLVIFLSWQTVLFIVFLAVLVFLSSVFIYLLLYAYSTIEKSIENKAHQYTLLNQNTEKNRIVFLGDSLTEFYREDEFFDHIRIYNRGIAGDTTLGVLRRLDSNVIVLKPSKIFLLIGTNDLGKRKPVDYIIHNIHIILSRIQKSLPLTKIYVLSLYPVNARAVRFSPAIVNFRKNKDILAINQLLAKLAKKHNVTFINVHPHLLDDKGNLDKSYTIEGLHINFYGYLKITEVLRPYVEE